MYRKYFLLLYVINFLFILSSCGTRCGYSDGIYKSTVDYEGVETNSTYTINVEVEDCQVIAVNFDLFNNYSWKNIDVPVDIDDNGDAVFYDNYQNKYTVHVGRYDY